MFSLLGCPKFLTTFKYSFFLLLLVLMGFYLLKPHNASCALHQQVMETSPLKDKTDPDSPNNSIKVQPSQKILNCLLERMEPDIFKAGVSIHINYPALGVTEIDADIKHWVTGIADAFTSGCEENVFDDANASEYSPTLKDATSQPSGFEYLLPSGSKDRKQSELWGTYQITRPSSKVISIAFELWNYTGNPEGNVDIITLNYNLLTFQRLNLVDLFEKPDMALNLMSEYSRKELAGKLGGLFRSKMLIEGTEPLVENFSSLTLTPDGICINFQPWQVAPVSAGIQRIHMPLSELMPSLPMLDLWERG